MPTRRLTLSSSSSSSPLALFDAVYFPDVPEAVDSTGTYVSPIAMINKEIRRKNVAAAAAAAATTGGGGSGGPNLNFGAGLYSDPWDFTGSDASPSSMQQQLQLQSMIPAASVSPSQYCNCSTRTSSETTSGLLCPTCGKRFEPTNLAWPHPLSSPTRKPSLSMASPELKRRGSSGTTALFEANGRSLTTSSSGGGPGLGDFFPGEPQHVAALLQCTPQLRVLSPASTDLQGGIGQPPTSRNFLFQFVTGGAVGGGGGNPSATTTLKDDHPTTSLDEYRASLLRDRANQQAATELASLLWVLAHEMSLEDYGTVESEVFSAVFGLVHSTVKESRMAGLAAVDALLATPSADEEKKAIKFANTLSNGLRSANGDYEFLSAVSKALGHMAKRTANVDFVESEVTRALEWLRTDRSDRRLAACLTLKEFAIHAPTTFHSKTSQSTLGKGGSNEFLDHIFQAIRDPQPIVRAAAADALSQCLKLLVERRHASLTGLLCRVYFDTLDGLRIDTSNTPAKKWQIVAAAEASQHGSLLVVATLVAFTRDFMIPRIEEACREVLRFATHPKALIRLEVIRLLPRLARRSPHVFGRRFLEESLLFLIESASTPSSPRVSVDVRPTAYASLGQLVLAMTVKKDGVREVIGASCAPTIKFSDDPDNPGTAHIVDLRPTGIIYEKLGTIFRLVRKGLTPSTVTVNMPLSSTLSPSLHCAANLVEALGDLALPYIGDLINEMFSAGLSSDLIRCLHSIAQCVPGQQSEIEERMLQEVSYCLTGMRDEYDPLASFHAAALESRAHRNVRNRKRVSNDRDLSIADSGSELQEMLRIDRSEDPSTIKALVHSLQTLAFFGRVNGGVTTSGVVIPLLPFVQDVVVQYLAHPSSEVRRAAALTCCVLLIAPGTDLLHVGKYTGGITEDVLGRLLRVAVSDPSTVVRLCVIRALDSRYDSYLCQNHHLQELFVLLQDEAVAPRAASLQLLGRLAKTNPAPILPVLRRFLDDLIVELQCGVDSGRGREDAIRLLVVFLRAKSLQKLIPPVLASLVKTLPLDNSAPPRLASASLEALGVLAEATGTALKPWLKDVVPHVLEIMQDQSSASKQRTSFRTLGQIAGSTGYVVRPYLDYPNLLTQATDILPATKRAPWSLRREVIRTLGILGALDPDRVVSTARKGGAVGGAYFEELDLHAIGGEVATEAHGNRLLHSSGEPIPTKKRSRSSILPTSADAEDDLPAFLFMYEQYTMVAQPLSTLPPAKRLSPSDEDFYPTVAIQALMRIFRDQGLAAHHGMVIQAIMFIFKSLGLGCVPYLRRVVPTLIQTVRTCSSTTLREALLQQLAVLSLIAREHLRPYIADMFDVVEQFWSSRHLATILGLISKIALGVPDEFRRFVPRLIKRLLTTLDELQIADWPAESSQEHALNRARLESERLTLVLRSVSNLKGVLGDYLHVLVPSFLKLADSLASLSLNGCPGLGEQVLLDLHTTLYRTISGLLESQSSAGSMLSTPFYSLDDNFTFVKSSENGLPSRVVQPLVRILREKSPKSPTLGLAIIETLCVCARLIGGYTWKKLYDVRVRQTIREWQLSFPIIPPAAAASTLASSTDERLVACLKFYDDAIEDLLRPAAAQPRDFSVMRSTSLMVDNPHYWGDSSGGTTYNLDLIETFDLPVSSPPYLVQQAVSSHRVNQSNLQRAWDVSQKASRDDWDEWMRRLAIQLLREAPSPSLRATANLAHAYQPLARELFSAAFSCCWKELSEPYKANLVLALETAFVADVSPEILQALLNLAEFMEHDPSGGLPIAIPILADLALKCRAYAKALHYREREYRLGGSNSCVESLISINQKLDLPEAALGVLKASSMGGQIVQEDENPEGGIDFTSKHKICDMFYSVLWNTEPPNSVHTIDLTSRQEQWLARLGNWTEALSVYQEKLKRDPSDFEALLGCMRCLDSSSEWMEVLRLFDENLSTMISPSAGNDLQLREDIAPRSKRKALRMCAHAAWRLGQWDDLDRYASELNRGPSAHEHQVLYPPTSSPDRTENSIAKIEDFDAAFYSAVLRVHRQKWPEAAEAIDAARRAMDGRLTALMAESYNRAYPSMVTAQTLAEMEEIIEFRQREELASSTSYQHLSSQSSEASARDNLLSVWRDRLSGCRVDAEAHASILAVRSLVLGPDDDIDSTLRLCALSQQAQRYSFAANILLRPLKDLKADLNGSEFGFGLSDSLGTRIDFDGIAPSSMAQAIDMVVVSDLKFIIRPYEPQHEQWARRLVKEAGGLERLMIQYKLYHAYVKHLWLTERCDEALFRVQKLCDVIDLVSHTEGINDNELRVSCFLELGDWKMSAAAPPTAHIEDRLQLEVLTSFKRATLLDSCGYKAWHAWALFNFRIAVQLGENPANQDTKRLRNHVVAAVRGFVNAISLGTKKESASVQQDLLNLLTCLFQYGNLQDVALVINDSIESVALEAWLGVLPQLLARIHIKDPSIRAVLHPLLTRLGEKHPQALMYPLSVLLKSPVTERKNAAESLMTSLKAHSKELVEEALMVSSELIRVAILWLETWHEGLEDASRLYFVEGNVAGMLDILLPLHDKVEAGAETWLENEFLKNFGQDLAQAHLHIQEYVRLVTEGGSSVPTGPDSTQNRHTIQSEEAEAAMNRAWDIYYTFFRRVNKQLPSLTTLELSQCSPALSRARGLELGVPGSYRVDGSYIKINKFVDSIQVITSKQRPRKITLRGSDGNDYMFLLKGHEDLRQDERVMQLFGLVNALLVRDPQTRKHDLRIQRYAISPLSHNCGVVGWVPHCDLLHSLIRDYRQSKNIPLNMENREMLKIAPDYDMLTVMQKVEVFTEALRKTTGRGNDLYEILWLKSTNSEEWLERRTKYTRSLAVMSIVGYILGLGDRHPSNLMLDKLTGRVLHIDFGDCFEVAMNREKYPERVPFRLTRMLIKAMEVSGIEGSYRSTSERVMSVLRASRDSLVAMLEAFVYDPLISWRLVDLDPGGPSDLSSSRNVRDRRGAAVERRIGASPFNSSSQQSGVPIDYAGADRLPDVSEHPNEEEDDHEGSELPVLAAAPPSRGSHFLAMAASRGRPLTAGSALGGGSHQPYHPMMNAGNGSASSNTQRSRSMLMYSNIQMMAANVSTESRIASLTAGTTARGGGGGGGVTVGGAAGLAGASSHDQHPHGSSIARSRMERSMRQRELMSLLEGEGGAAHEEALNEKALKVIRRVQDKLTGNDFGGDTEPTDVTDQVQRLIVQATSSENLCQLFVGWCAFW